MSDLVALGAAAGVPSKQLAPVPYPIRSTIVEIEGQAPESVEVEWTSATFPAPAAIAIDEVASGAGNIVPAVPPEAN